MPPAAMPFDVSADSLASLAGTRPAPDHTALLHAGLHSRRLVLLRALFARVERAPLPPRFRQWLDWHWWLLERAEACDPLAVRHALAYPTVGNWLVDALSPASGRAPAEAGGASQPGADGPFREASRDTVVDSFGDAFRDALGGFGVLAATAALHAGLGFCTTLPTRAGRLTLPGIGAYETRAERVRVVAGPRSLRLGPDDRRARTLLLPPYSRATGSGWRGLHPLPCGPSGSYGGVPAGSAGGQATAASAVLDDLDPYRTGPRPLSGGGAPQHGGRGTDDVVHRAWEARWRAGLALLRSADAERCAEVTGLVRALVPMAGPRGGTVSATLRSAPWAVLTGLPGSAAGMAAVLVHEVQHSKLAVLTEVLPLLYARTDLREAGSSEPGPPGAGGAGAAVHKVGWRSDPRPVGAVLQGTYAHLALADLWRRLADRRGATPAARLLAHKHCESYREQVGDALAVLTGSGELTSVGEEFAHGMRRQLAELAEPAARPSRARAGGAGYGVGRQVTVR